MNLLENWTEQIRSLRDHPPSEVGQFRLLVERLCNSLADSVTGPQHQANIAQFRANVDRCLHEGLPEKLPDDFLNGATWGVLAAALGFLGFFQNQFQHLENVDQTVVGEILRFLESGASRSTEIAQALGRDRSQISRALKRLVKENLVVEESQSNGDRRARWYRLVRDRLEPVPGAAQRALQKVG